MSVMQSGTQMVKLKAGSKGLVRLFYLDEHRSCIRWKPSRKSEKAKSEHSHTRKCTSTTCCITCASHPLTLCTEFNTDQFVYPEIAESFSLLPCFYPLLCQGKSSFGKQASEELKKYKQSSTDLQLRQSYFKAIKYINKFFVAFHWQVVEYGLLEF